MSNDLIKAQERVERLREKVTEARSERDTRLREHNTTGIVEALNAEGDRLQVELDGLGEEKKVHEAKVKKAGKGAAAEPTEVAATSAGKE